MAHFVAHTKAIVALQWDPSGSLLLTADIAGHNFHLFRFVMAITHLGQDNLSNLCYSGSRPTRWARPSPRCTTCTPCTGETRPAPCRTSHSPPTAGTRAVYRNLCCKTIHRFYNRLYNHGEGPY